MTDAAPNHLASPGDQHGRTAGPAQVSAGPAQVSAGPAQESAELAKESADLAPESVPRPARERRRWFQCSVRTMLLGTAMIACGLGLFVYKIDRARLVVAAIEEVGGTCEYRGSPPKSGRIRAWLRRHLPRSYFDEVIYIFADHNAKITDAELAHLSALTSLEFLFLNGTRVSDAGLVQLSSLTSLRWLNLSETQVTDAALVRLSALTSLKRVDLRGTQVTDAGLAHLSSLTSLEILDLRGTQVTDAGLEHLSALTSLNWLDLCETQVTDAAVTTLRKSLPTLEVKTK